MGSTFFSLHHHIVFSTKERRPLIRPEWRPTLHRYLGGTVRGLGAVPEVVGGVEDHVHLLVGVRTTHTPSALVRELKKASSAWVVANQDRLFSWQEGYAIFSASWTHTPALRRYIADQEAHHRRSSFAEELQRLLEKNGMRYDPNCLL
jgi:putative transposase